MAVSGSEHHVLVQHGYWFLMGSVVFIALLVSWLVSFMTSRLTPKLAKTPFFWDESFIRSIYAPVLTLIWLLCGTFLASIVLNKLGVKNSPWFDIARMHQFTVILVLFWFLMRYIRNIELHLIEAPLAHARFLNNKTNVRATTQVIRIIVLAVFGLSLMKALGIEITTLLAFGSLGGLAISFAAKDSLANFFGGMMIYWDRPFAEGDWVRSPDRNIEGTVEHIGWRLTRIRSFDKRPVYVPNGVFSNIIIENPQRMTNRRIKATVGLRYEDAPKLKVILEDIERMLKSHPEIDTNQTLMVNLYEFGASALNVLVYTFTKTTKWTHFQAIQQDVFLQIIGIITKHGAECAYPTTTLHVPDGVELNQ